MLFTSLNETFNEIGKENKDESRQTNQNSENQDSRIFSKKSLFGKREKESK